MAGGGRHPLTSRHPLTLAHRFTRIGLAPGHLGFGSVGESGRSETVRGGDPRRSGWGEWLVVGCGAGTVTTMVRISKSTHVQMVSHAISGLPNEACGLLGGRWGGDSIEAFVPTRNADESAKTYAIGPDGFLVADRQLGPLGLDVVGVMHSHTHTDPYPSPTDVAKADNPLLEGWIYVIVSLRDTEPMLRAWLLDGATIVEQPVEIIEG